MPPNNSLTYRFALVKAYNTPIYSILDNIVFCEKLIEYEKTRIIDMSNWTNNSDKKLFIHTLKNHSDDVLIKLKKAKGLINIKIWTIIYLKEYVKRRLISPKLVKDFIIPSNDKILKLVLFT